MALGATRADYGAADPELAWGRRSGSGRAGAVAGSRGPALPVAATGRPRPVSRGLGLTASAAASTAVEVAVVSRSERGDTLLLGASAALLPLSGEIGRAHV